MISPLGKYVRAARGLGGLAVHSVERVPSVQLEEGVLEETLYCFADGAIVRYRVEQDKGNFDYPPENVYVPSEISYCVLVQPENACIEPAVKRFNNACRHLFWLKMQGQFEE